MLVDQCGFDDSVISARIYLGRQRRFLLTPG
jgi:hypothetical protein